MEYNLEIDEKEHAVSLLRSVSISRKEEEHCDLIIKIGNKEIPVHRNIVSAASDYFKAMLSHETKESRSGVVRMKDVDFESIMKCIEFIYTGKISISAKKCEQLLHAASMLQLNSLCAKIAPFLSSHLSTKSFFDIKRIASKFDLESLHSLCDEFALKNLDTLAKEEHLHFNQLEKDYVMLLISSKKTSSSHCEDAKLAIILQWTKADIKSRREHLEEMMQILDLKKVSLSYGKYVSMVEPICYESLQCMKMLYMSALEKLHTNAKPAEINFSCADEPNAILVFNEYERYLQAYKVETATWINYHNLCDGIMNNYYTAVVLSNHLYVLCANKKVFMLDLAEKLTRWYQIHDMTEEHGRYLRAVAYDDCIYVVGNNHIERYSKKNCDWEEIRCNSIPVDRCAVVECGGWIYTIGGFFGDELNIVHRFSPSSREWGTVNNMTVARATPAAAVLNDEIFVAGGYLGTFLTTVECYQPRTDAWSLIPAMTITRSNFAACVVGGKIYACGCGSKAMAVEVYDPEENVWKEIDMTYNPAIEASATVNVLLQE